MSPVAALSNIAAAPPNLSNSLLRSERQGSLQYWSHATLSEPNKKQCCEATTLPMPLVHSQAEAG
jgi:hypothetical protein